MSESFEVSRVIPAKPGRIFEAWLSPEEHSAFTKTRVIVNPDGTFSASDGYITGRTLETEPHRRIVQAWRTTEFPSASSDSRLEVLLEEASGGTKVTLRHSNLPDGQADQYRKGWEQYYFEPMEDYFGSIREKLKEAGDAIEEAGEQASRALDSAGEQVGEAFEAAAEQAGEVVEAVSQKAKTAAQKVKALVRKAQKGLGKAAKAAKKAAAKVTKKKPAKGKKKPPAKKPKKKAKPKKKSRR